MRTTVWSKHFAWQGTDLENNVKIRLLGERTRDGRQYNMPTASEIAALILGEQSDEPSERDIIVENKDKYLQRISELHPSFMSMQYPLLFPYGEDGFRPHPTTHESVNCDAREW